MIKSTNILKARVGGGKSWKVGPGQRDRISDDSDDTPKQRYEVSKEETRDGRVEQPVGGCCLGEKLEGDCPHNPSALEDDSLQE